ncbi:hypothetical protein Z517_09908 [Fonsecaea pedrosoi CBS 271.37]|uniref:BZIP domain-containing protein n=1 Tax=Fonsecaea pedrosoi CBS 271.37 TaxID=1442368 RepID=A0A0D2ETB9_9EURO|nr:uncharacterized protein Z517_09908 [Fonsecaea pedrosoi CBS 271.37]KIW77462.1 hypothetical protein Z517_09908 [Fonsecaea pedrosoi CBS 271.37]
MLFDGESPAETAPCSSSLIVDEEAELDLGDSHMDFGIYDLTAATSTPYVPGVGTTAGTTPYETESSGSYVTSPATTNTRSSKPRRRKARMNEVDEETQSRRRAQNRESQQAYRHRREDYIHNLQSRIVDLHLRHRDLWQSYYSQDRRLSLLREVAADLSMEVNVLRRRQSESQQHQHQQQNQHQHRQHHLLLTPDHSVCLGDEGDGITSLRVNDSIYEYTLCPSHYIEGNSMDFPAPSQSQNQTQGQDQNLQEWLSGTTGTYPPSGSSEYMGLA